MIDILDIVVPAYNAGITVDLVDYHKINGKKTVDKYVNIQQEQLEEVISYWDDRRKVQQATFFAAENGTKDRIVVVVCSYNYNYSDTFEKWIKNYRYALEEIANICADVPIRKDVTLINGAKVPIKFERLPVKKDRAINCTMLRSSCGDYSEEELKLNKELLDKLRDTVNKSIAETAGIPLELLSPMNSYEYDSKSGFLTNEQTEGIKEHIRTMASTGEFPKDLEAQIGVWAEMINSSETDHVAIDKLRKRIKEYEFVDDATKCFEEISAATGLPLEVVKSMYTENPGMADTYEAAYTKEENNG